MKQISTYSTHSKSSHTHAIPARTHAHNTRIALYAAFLFLGVLCSTNAFGVTTYKLLKEVTSVSAGKKYVFEQDGRVMTTTGGDTIKTTNSYNTTGLAGTENYVWEIVSTETANVYKLRNVTASSGYYLRNGKTSGSWSTKLSTTNTDNQNLWSFSFSASVATITNVESERYLGYRNDKKLGYGAFTTGDYGHSITVYRLDEESSCTNISAPSVTATRGDETITLTWEHQSEASSYNVTKTPAGGTVGTPSKSGSTWTCEITGLTNNTAYTWSVEAVGDGTTYCESGNTAASGTTTPKVMHTVTWKKDGKSYTTTTVADGEQPVFPSDPTSCDAEDYGYFYGWSTSTFISTDDISGKTIHTIASTMPVVTSDDVVYHAVFSDTDFGSYTLVSSNPGAANWAGDYLIAYSSTIFADGRIGGTGSGGIGANGTSVSPGDFLSSSTVSAKWGDVYYVTLEKIEDSNTYLLKTQDGKYNYVTTNSNGITTSTNSATAGSYPITVTFTSSSDVRLGLGGAASGAVFRYNTAGTFRYYKNCGQEAVYFYKRSARSSANYLTSCCDKIITFENNSPSNGTVVFDPAGPVIACDEDVDVTMTITPASGYQLSAFEVATGDGKVATKSVSPAISTADNSNDAQEITLTFAEDTDGEYNITATFDERVVTGWTWTYGGGAIPNPLEIYVDEQKQVDVVMTPNTNMLSSHIGNNSYKHDVASAYIKNPNRSADKFTFTGKAAVASTTITLTHNDDDSESPTFAQTINVRVKALPTVTFIDLVHNKTDFTNWGTDGVVASTASDGVVTHTKPTPSHDDLDVPGSGNSCETTHLHLVGWIRSDYSPVVAYLNGTGAALVDDDFTSAGTDAGSLKYFLDPNEDIDIEDYNGKTFYAVWSELE